MARVTLILMTLLGCADDDRQRVDGARPDSVPMDAAADLGGGCAPGARQACRVGACAGEQRCLGGRYGPCEGPAERCDGRDDDCDGEVDEGFAVGAPCVVGLGRCAAAGTLRCGAGGDSVCLGVPGAPNPESCDGRDEDCDGAVDEGEGGPLRRPCYGGPAGTVGVGLCREGEALCVDGRWSACDGVTPTPERCDGADQDCDGAVDEGGGGPLLEACYSGPPGTEGIGACRAGLAECGLQGPGPCRGEVGPTAELCPGVDDDCDGAIDEDAVAEGGACAVGIGACRREGRLVCLEGRVRCAAIAGEPSPEICNELDDDCDGVVDPEPICEPFASCLTALRAGWTRSGVYRLRPGPDLSDAYVWCDQETDGGGWTLVGAAATPLSDEAGSAHPDLRGTSPRHGETAIWSGLRHLDVRFDTRFACRRDAAIDRFAVDFTVYGVDWYPGWTRGTEIESCFVGAGGEGAATPARRDHHSGRWHPRGTPWAGGALYGEAACEAPADLAVELADQIDGEPRADWGVIAGAPRCAGPGGAQWLLFVREGSRWRPDGDFAVSEGEPFAEARTWSCAEICRQRVGVAEAPRAAFGCSTRAEAFDRRAWLDGWGEPHRFCGDDAAPDAFVLPAEGDSYTCASGDCTSWSAWVNDHGCHLRNQCWRAFAPPAFLAPAVGTTGEVGRQAGARWTICAADAASARLEGDGRYDPSAACAGLGYREAEPAAAACPEPCGECDPQPPPLAGPTRWTCRR